MVTTARECDPPSVSRPVFTSGMPTAVRSKSTRWLARGDGTATPRMTRPCISATSGFGQRAIRYSGGYFGQHLGQVAGAHDHPGERGVQLGQKPGIVMLVGTR